MKKVYPLAPGENWICDRMVAEWTADNPDITAPDPISADIIWLLADWCWRQLPWGLLQEKTVVTTVHHIVPEKFTPAEVNDFMMRDKITDYYHVYNQRTYDFIRPLTMKSIILIPYWANQKIFKRTVETVQDKEALRQKFGFGTDTYLIGSFQRDTEGHDLKSPKLEKGPDLLADAIEQYDKQCRDVIGHVGVILADWRRQYIMGRLDAVGIKYHYFERPPQQTIVELYQTLDLYPVTARHEGGPQSLIECGLLGIYTVSRPVGIAEQVLPGRAIDDDVTRAVPTVPKVKDWLLPGGYQPYRDFFKVL
jgi:glycosyltransferase involved in cell wall biosynthesis